MKSVRKDTIVVGLKWAQWPGKGTAWNMLASTNEQTKHMSSLKIRALLMLGLGFKLELLISFSCLSIFVQTLCKDFSFRLWLCFSQPLKALKPCASNLIHEYLYWDFYIISVIIFPWKGQINCTSNKLMFFNRHWSRLYRVKTIKAFLKSQQTAGHQWLVWDKD